MPPRLLVIGDVAWDIFIRPERDLVRGSDVLGTVDVMPGGAAANVAVWAHRLGADVTLVCKLGDDTLGSLMLTHLRAEGVGRHAITVPGGLTTRVGILVGPDGEHSFVIDHTKVLLFDESDVPAALVDGVDAVFFNGYDIFLRQSTAYLDPVLREARRRGVTTVFDPSSFTLIERYGARRLLDGVGRLDLLIANDAEAAVLSGSAPLASLAGRAGLVVVKQGAAGASAHAADDAWCAAPVPITAVDTTGAGGNRLGAHVAGRLGAQPPR
ncbi:MAG: carbohydrate kinase family protein [Acidobacteria bacterium]|nr:carbohydrate kinase family protein [Acidobacteriota bacterium]